MSEEEESNNENEENEDEENGDEEGEEKEDDENDDEENEGEENEDDENGDEENEEGEEKEDDEEEDEEEKEDKKKKKGKKKENKKEEEKKEEQPQSSKFSEDKLLPSKEIKMDLNLNSSNSNNIYFNGNDITLANINPPKKSTLQLLLEISSEMETLSSHLEKVLPSPKYNNIEYNPNNYSYPIINNNIDNQDLEIKNLIEKANAMTNKSILNKSKEENGDVNNVKTYEDKCCQSDDEIEYSYHQQMEENKSREECNNNYNNRRFPYDPYKNMDYYNDLKNSNNGNNFYRRRPFIYSQPEFSNDYNNNYYKGNDIPFERYKSGNIEKAMDILLDKK